ncbi:MAG: ATP-dependent helicase HrpB [Verrucomicrobiota bacterium]
MTLPIYEVEPQLRSAFESESARAIIEAPTGSGKSTQVPQILLDSGLAGDGQIVVLQPRRLAARVLAQRVAAERGETAGGTVGYEVRFERAVSKNTRIRYITEGVLLREMLEDPELSRISILLFDEFHERHLYGDLSLAMAKRLQESARPDLKIGVMSATLQTEILESYLSPSITVSSEGRTFPVEISYSDRSVRGDVWDAAADVWHQEAKRGIEGDVLIFMPGGYEIDRTLRAISEFREADDWELYPLHAELPPERQDAALKRYSRQKVIVSTNVAETSLTIDGVRLVIDSGLARQARFDPNRGFDALTIERISRASADQRSGRAGRTAPGKCLRLWTENENRSRAVAELPEVKRVDLAEVLLTLRGLGIERSEDFDWVEVPLSQSLERAEQLLHDLGAVRNGELTQIGKQMLTFPVHPRFSRMLIEAGGRQCVRPIAVIAALCQGKPLLLRKVGRHVEELRDDLFGDVGLSDFFRELRAFQYAKSQNYHQGNCRKLGIHVATARQTERLATRFIGIAEKAKIQLEEGSANEEGIRRCVLAGFADQVARRRDGGTLRCELVHRRKGEIERGSVVRDSEFVVAAEITEVEKSSGDLDVLLRRVTGIESSWLLEMFPDECVTRDVIAFDEHTRRITAVRATVFREMVVEESGQGEPNEAEAARLLAEQVMEGRCPLKQWNAEVENWIIRLNCLADWYPEAELVKIGPVERQSLIEQVCLGAISYKEIKDRPVFPVVRSWLSEGQQVMLDQMVPERWKMPNNRRLKVRYQEGKEPVLAAKIQNLYDLKEHPKLVNGQVSVVLEILGPNMRPVQVTQDLPNFWKETYPKLKPELARRYPKHEWR